MPLLTSNIIPVESNSDAWHDLRCGKFTSSEISSLMGTKPMSYIYRKVGESITGKPAKENFDTEATIHGVVNEIAGMSAYLKARNINPMLLRIGVFIKNGELFGSTPDGIEILSGREDVDGYSVKPIEVKCPLTYEAFIKLKLCKTPWDVKRENNSYFYQVLDQLDNCDALAGALVIYHPSFPQGANLNIIDFRIMEPDKDKKFPLREELQKLKDAKKLAVKQFNQIKEQLLK